MSDFEESSAMVEAGPEQTPAALQRRALDFLGDVPLEITVELGRTKMSILELLKLGPASILELNRSSDDPLEVRANGVLIARGEAVVVNDRFGLRLSSIVTPDRILGSVQGGEQ